MRFDESPDTVMPPPAEASAMPAVELPASAAAPDTRSADERAAEATDIDELLAAYSSEPDVALADSPPRRTSIAPGVSSAPTPAVPTTAATPTRAASPPTRGRTSPGAGRRAQRGRSMTVEAAVAPSSRGTVSDPRLVDHSELDSDLSTDDISESIIPLSGDSRDRASTVSGGEEVAKNPELDPLRRSSIVADMKAGAQLLKFNKRRRGHHVREFWIDDTEQHLCWGKPKAKHTFNKARAVPLSQVYNIVRQPSRVKLRGDRETMTLVVQATTRSVEVAVPMDRPEMYHAWIDGMCQLCIERSPVFRDRILAKQALAARLTASASASST